MNWYDLPPAKYAEGLRYGADRSDESAKRREAEGRAWSAGEAAHFRRQARRCRAMALLCENSKASHAGDVDFRRLNDPSFPMEDEQRVVAQIEAEHGQT